MSVRFGRVAHGDAEDEVAGTIARERGALLRRSFDEHAAPSKTLASVLLDAVARTQFEVGDDAKYWKKNWSSHCGRCHFTSGAVVASLKATLTLGKPKRGSGESHPQTQERKL